MKRRVEHNVRTTLLSAVLTILGIVSAPGQSFRGEIVEHRTVAAGEAIERDLQAGQVMLIEISETVERFTSALEIEIRTPSPAPPSGAFSIAVYGAVDDPDTEGFTTLAGTPLGTIPLGTGATHRVSVPLVGTDEQPAEAGVNVTRPADPSVGAVGIQLVPAMKGLSSTDADRAFPVRIQPVLRPVGAVRIEVDGEPDLLQRVRPLLAVTLDGETIAIEEIVEREPGIYRLEADAGDFLDYTSNIGIDQGRVRTVRLRPHEPRSFIRLAVPSVADVYWDGELILERGTLTVSPGTHRLMIRLGDFSVSRDVELSADESYEVGIDLDILLKRD